MADAPKFLIVDGYPKESREQFDQVGMRKAGILYADMLKAHCPQAECEIWYSSDDGAKRYTREDLDGFAGILWPGCNLTVYHDDPRVRAHLELADLGFEVGLPQFGSCWALQVACHVAGGTCAAHPRGREMGLAMNIHLSEAGRNHPMYEGKPPVFAGFCSHDDEVTALPPEGAVLLSGNDWSRIQAAEIRYKQGVFWSVQYHPEYDLHEMARLILAREPKLVKQGLFLGHDDLAAYVDRLEELAADPSRKDLRWQLRIADDVLDPGIRQCEFSNWLKHQALKT